jgi:hypothetical protein
MLTDILILIAALGGWLLLFVATEGWLREGKKLEEARKEIEYLRTEVHIRNTAIKKLEGKLMVKTTTDYYNDIKGDKK